MNTFLKESMPVAFAKLALDPNNPRIAPQTRPGYDDPAPIFDDAVQTSLTKAIEDNDHGISDLEEKILHQGWVPMEPILVWEHNKKKGHFIVVEGNRRTVVLRRIRARLVREEEKLARMTAQSKKYAKHELVEQERIIARIKSIIEDTDKLTVFPVNAKTADELEELLPRLLSVRHISHAREWSPYATNLYVLSLYTQLHEDKYGPTAELTLTSELIDAVCQKVPTGPTETRRNIQAASAFSHFRRHFEDKLSEGDEFSDGDQNYFAEILKRKFTQQQFGFGKDDLRLAPEMEEVLFEWAFKHPRGEGDENKNVLRIAEDFRLWSNMKAYDDKNGTSFGTKLDVEDPGQATEMAVIEAEYLAHKTRVSPLVTIQSLLESFKKIQADTLLSQASHLRPMLEDLCKTGATFLKMIDAVTEKPKK